MDDTGGPTTREARDPGMASPSRKSWLRSLIAVGLGLVTGIIVGLAVLVVLVVVVWGWLTGWQFYKIE